MKPPPAAARHELCSQTTEPACLPALSLSCSLCKQLEAWLVTKAQLLYLHAVNMKEATAHARKLMQSPLTIQHLCQVVGGVENLRAIVDNVAKGKASTGQLQMASARRNAQETYMALSTAAALCLKRLSPGRQHAGPLTGEQLQEVEAVCGERRYSLHCISRWPHAHPCLSSCAWLQGSCKQI